MCINLWNRCDFAVNYLEVQKTIPTLSTFYSHEKILWFQLVMLVTHNKKKSYSSKLFSEENSAQYSSKPFTLFTKDKWREVETCDTPFQGNGILPYIVSQVVIQPVYILKTMLFTPVNEFTHSQKPSFYPPFYTRFIHMCLYFDFNRLAVL